MHCIKLLGDKLSARNFDSQVNEIHARVAMLNKFTELGQLTPKLSLKFEQISKALSLKSLCNKPSGLAGLWRVLCCVTGKLF